MVVTHWPMKDVTATQMLEECGEDLVVENLVDTNALHKLPYILKEREGRERIKRK